MLSALGLFVNLVGAILLYRSIKPTTGRALLRADAEKIKNERQRGEPYDPEKYKLQPVVALEQRLAKTGLACIIAGFAVQFLAVLF